MKAAGRKSRLLVAALTLAVLAIGWPGIRQLITLRVSAFFVTGNDFGPLKVLYAELYAANRLKHDVAGVEMDFPIDTDSRRPAQSSSLALLSRNMLREIVINEAYDGQQTTGPTETREVNVVCNQWRRLMADQKLISRLVIKPLGTVPITNALLFLVREIPQETSETAIDRSMRLFEKFIEHRRNGVSPLGTNFHIPYETFVSVYGYGQCENQSYALADVFSKNDINSRLVRTQSPSHTVLEAELRPGAWALFDPLLGLAFVDRNKEEFLSFEMVRAELDKSLASFGVEQTAVARQYYQGSGLSVTAWTDEYNAVPPPLFSIQLGEEMELCFDCSYPWISARSALPPPEGGLAFLKKRVGIGTSFDLYSEFPFVEVEVRAGDIPGDITVDGVHSTPILAGERLRLCRYIKSQHRVEIMATTPVAVTTVAQCSALQFYRRTDAFLMVRSASDANCSIMLEFYSN